MKNIIIKDRVIKIYKPSELTRYITNVVYDQIEKMVYVYSGTSLIAEVRARIEPIDECTTNECLSSFGLSNTIVFNAMD